MHDLSIEKVKQMRDQATAHIKAKRISDAISVLDLLNQSGYPSKRMYIQYAVCYLEKEEYETAYRYIEDAQLDFKKLHTYGIDDYYISMYNICVVVGQYKKGLDIVNAWLNNQMVSRNWKEDPDKITRYGFSLTAICHFYLEEWEMLYKSVDLALKCYDKYGYLTKSKNQSRGHSFDIEYQFIRPYSKGKLSRMYVDDKDTEMLCFYYLYAEMKLGIISNRSFFDSIYNAAQGGSLIARKHLNEANVDY